MLQEGAIERVDRFAEKLRDRLQAIGKNGEWGEVFELSRPPASTHYRARVIVGGQPIDKNWIQLNFHSYDHPSYSSPKPWLIQARFISPPGSPLWEKKEQYIRNRPSREFSLGGLDVWAISYENLDQALSNQSEDDVIEEILRDLRVSWAYANGQQLPEDFLDSRQSAGRIDVTLSIDAALWAEFQQLYAQRYRSRKKHPKRPAYAELRDDAVHAALRDYIEKWRKRPGQSEDN